MGMVLNNGPEAARVCGEEIPFLFFFFNDKWLRMLLAYKREREDGMAVGRAQLLYTGTRRSTGSRCTHKTLRPTLGNAHPGKEKCLEKFMAKTCLL